MNPSQLAHDLLANLGDDYITVATNLRDFGVKGLPRKPKQCPVYNYLRANGVDVIHCSPASTYLRDAVGVECPSAVIKFMAEFDDVDRPVRFDEFHKGPDYSRLPEDLYKSLLLENQP